ncbi:MAG TPA: leucyl aminopeptidase [Burkholderiaceae bacterium]|nr:leucyl aminopeptidase [Burkholderiaceae bacterium]
MDFEFRRLNLADAAQTKTDALVVLWPDAPALPPAPEAEFPLLSWLQRVSAEGLLESGVGKSLLNAGASLCLAPRVVVVRVGVGSETDIRKACSSAFALLRNAGVKKALLHMGLLADVTATGIRAACVAVAEATYEYTATKPSAKGRHLTRLSIAHGQLPRASAWVSEAAAWVQGIELAKEWANRPANHATPRLLAEAAEQLGQHKRMKVEVLGPKEVAKLGMGAFMAVAQGSEEPLRFIVVRYNGASKDQAPLVLVGKGITFDTGGISIKPAPEMDEMKFDMGGAASVLGTLHAIGLLQPDINVVGLIPSCENMPDGRAVKPGDVVTSMSGQTIEILNTDAEGRLILCDALAYAARFKPAQVIDVATLTGACVIALGHVRTGLFANQDELAASLLKAGEQAQDPCWRMPLDDEYGEGLKSSFADMANVAGRPGGSVSAAKFLEKFVPGLTWAHLDIAGTAWKSGAAKGGTGRPVALLVQHVLNEAQRLPSAAKGKRSTQSVARPATPPARSR